MAIDKSTTPAVLAVIRESDCIGCTKCIAVCPVDAILGAAQWMHTVIASECIGCKLCIAPCPVDCIELIPVDTNHQRIPPEYVKQRYQARQLRLNQENTPTIPSADARKKYLAEALTRAKGKNK